MSARPLASAARATAARQIIRQKLIEEKRHIAKHGEDFREIRS